MDVVVTLVREGGWAPIFTVLDLLSLPSPQLSTHSPPPPPLSFSVSPPFSLSLSGLLPLVLTAIFAQFTRDKRNF